MEKTDVPSEGVCLSFLQFKSVHLPFLAIYNLVFYPLSESISPILYLSVSQSLFCASGPYAKAKKPPSFLNLLHS